MTYRLFDWFLMGLFGGMGFFLSLAMLRFIASFISHADGARIL